MRNAENIGAILDNRSIPITDSGCQIWLGTLSAQGYGALSIRGEPKLTHRLAWERARGAIPAGMYVCHQCDIRCCVNPDHLFLGCHLDNISDMVAKGRNKTTAHFKFSEEIEREIRAATGSHRSIARRFGTTHSTIARIKSATGRDVRGFIFVDPSSRVAGLP